MAKDFPLNEIAEACEKVVAKGQHFHQKWTCRHCGSRQTMDEQDKLFTSGKCEACGRTTDIQARGCNYLIIAHNMSLEDVLRLTE